MKEDQVMFWFYSGPAAARRSKAKAAEIFGAHLISRAEFDRKELVLPDGVVATLSDWEVVVFTNSMAVFMGCAVEPEPPG